MQNWLITFLLILTVFTGCGKQPQQNSTEKTLRFSINRDPTSLDPRRGADVISSLFQSLLYEGLTKLDENQITTLALAEKIDISEDYTVYTFHLKDTLWSDGSPVTAEDFEKTWKTQLDPDFPSPNAHLFFCIKNGEAAKKGLVPLEDVGVKARDPKTLEVTLAAPTSYFLKITSFCAYAPVNNLLTNGPYLLKSVKHNQEFILEKNPNYWNHQATGINTLQIYVIDNEMTTLHMYENGDLDLIASALSPIPLDALSEYANHPTLHTVEQAGSTVCFFNTGVFPFHNQHIRKAFALAINREEIVANITQPRELAATGIIPPILKEQKTRVFFNDHDVEGAKLHLKLGLEELGIQELGEIIYNYSSTEKDRKTAQALQQQWAKTLGVCVKLEQVEYKTLQEKFYKREYAFAQGIWIAQYLDPFNILERFKIKSNTKNYPGWENPSFAKLLDESNYAEAPEERMRLLEEAETLFIEEMPLSPIFHWKSAILAKPHLKLPPCSPICSSFYEHIELQN